MRQPKPAVLSHIPGNELDWPLLQVILLLGSPAESRKDWKNITSICIAVQQATVILIRTAFHQVDAYSHTNYANQQ